MTKPAPTPAEPAGHALLHNRTVVITAAAGSGIGGSLARRCMLEGAKFVISDAHERRLNETADALAEEHRPRAAAAAPAEAPRPRAAAAAPAEEPRHRPAPH